MFPILFHVKVCVGAMLNFQTRKRVTIKSANLIYTENNCFLPIESHGLFNEPTNLRIQTKISSAEII